MDPEKTAFYLVTPGAGDNPLWWMQELAETVAGRNGSYYANTGWNMNSPAAVRRIEEVFAMLGLESCLETCIGVPAATFAQPACYSDADGT